MAIKVAILVIIATVYSVYPQLAETKTVCNPNAVYNTVIIGTDGTYNLIGCTASNGEMCIDGLPPNECTPLNKFLALCYLYTWHAGEFDWSVTICQHVLPQPGDCYETELQKSCQELDIQTTGVETVTLNSECLCVEDTTIGAKACIPENCDVDRLPN